MSRSRYRFAEPDRPDFLTCTVVEWLPVFTRPETIQIVFDSWTTCNAGKGCGCMVSWCSKTTYMPSPRPRICQRPGLVSSLTRQAGLLICLKRKVPNHC